MTTKMSQSSQTFDDVVRHGPPVNALEFPAPRVQEAVRETVQARNPETQQLELCHNVLRRVDDDVAYWPQKRLQDAIYGSVWHCVVLRRSAAETTKKPTPMKPSRKRPTPIAIGAGLLSKKYNTPKTTKAQQQVPVWDIRTDESVAVKQLDLARIRSMGPRLAEDPMKEVSAMQWLAGQPHPNVVSTLAVLQDDQYLYSVMPFCRDGDLFDVVQRHMDVNGGDLGMPEDVARIYFRQILDGVQHLQDQGLCHRDLSLENIMVDKGVAKIIDFGMCLKVPYVNAAGTQVVDVTQTQSTPPRRLRMTPQGTCGKWKYMSPEVRKNRHPMDGFAVDLWSVGVILFAMLTGFPPYEQPLPTDAMYRHIVTLKHLQHVLQRHWKLPLSDEACDLLQHMLQEDPRDRLTLEQIRQHPWVTAGSPKRDNDSDMIEDHSGVLSDDNLL